MFDLDKGTYSNLKGSNSHSDWLGLAASNSESYADTKYSFNMGKAIPGAKFQGYSFHNYGNNDFFFWGASPDIDTKLSIDFWKMKNNTYEVSGRVFGDRFPANETFLTDAKGKSVFLGVSGAKGDPYSSLTL